MPLHVRTAICGRYLFLWTSPPSNDVLVSTSSDSHTALAAERGQWLCRDPLDGFLFLVWPACKVNVIRGGCLDWVLRMPPDVIEPPFSTRLAAFALSSFPGL